MQGERFAAQQLSLLLKVVSHPHRLLIVQMLASSGELNVSDIANRLGVPAVRVSQHLAALRLHRLVDETPRGRERRYSLVSGELTHWLVDGLTGFTHAVGDAPGE